MKRPGIMMLLAATSIHTCFASDDWIGLDDDEPVLIGIELGEDEAQDSSRALLLGLPFGDSAGFYGYYGETQLTDQDQQFDSLSLASTVWIQLSTLVDIEVQHFFEGQSGELEQETLGLALGFTHRDWNFRLQYRDGETILFTREDISDFLSDFIPDRFTTDVAAFGLSVGRQTDPWYWQASFQRYDYDADLTPLSQSRFAQFIVKASALAQSSLLISQNLSLLVGHADFDNDYSVAISQDRSAIDESYDETLLLSWQHWSSQRFGYLLAASMPLPVDDEYGFTLGLRWML